MEQTATRDAFAALSTKQQDALATVLQACNKNGLSCRCEMTGGRDFTIIIAPGLSSAKWWMDRFDIESD